MGALFRKMFAKDDGDLKAEVHLAAFGKHPGWDDHIEDLGLDTAYLVAVRRVLYLQGVGGNIDAGAWERGDPDDHLPGYHHVFMWRFGPDLVLGRMWSSRDGKGRTRYPMIVCAHTTQIPLRWALQEIAPRLEEIEQRCTATTSANDVRATIAEFQQTLRRLAQGVQPTPESAAASPRAAARLADRPEMEPDHQGLYRVVYQIEREMSAYLPRTEEGAPGTNIIRPHQMRVPLCAESRDEAIQLWLGFLMGRLDRAAPILIFAHLEQPWLDLVVGEPGVQQFYCVRAALKSIPFATEIPYTLEPGFVARIERDVEASRTGRADATIEAPPPRPRPRTVPPPEREREIAGPPAPSRGFLRRFWWLILLILVFTALAIYGPRLADMLESLPKETAPPEPVGWKADDERAWQDLCTAYHGWFALLLNDADADRLARWRQDSELASLVVAPLEAARAVAIDPRRIIGEPSADLDEMADDAPDAAKAPDAVAATRKALAALEAVRDGIARWPAAGDTPIATLAKAYADERGWAGQAEELQKAVAEVEPGPGNAVAKAIDHALELKAQAAVVEALHAKTRRHRTALAVLGDGPAAMFDKIATARVAAAGSLAELQAALAAFEPEAARLAAGAADVQTCRGRMAETATPAIADRFVHCVRATVEGATALDDVTARLSRSKRLCADVETRLQAIKTHRDAIVALGDKALAAALWTCTATEAQAASSLMALNETLERVKGVAPKLVAVRKQIDRDRAAMAALGEATLERHRQHTAESLRGAKDTRSLLESLSRSQKLSAGVAARWADIQALQKTIVASGDKILARFATYPPARVNAENNIETLPATLDEIEAAAAQLAELVERDWKTNRIDRERFTASAAIHKQPPEGDVTDETLRAWRTQVVAYYRLDAAADPRQPSDLWDTPVQDVRWRIDFLLETDDPAQKQKGSRHAKRLAALTAGLDSLRKLPWTKGNQASIVERAAILRKLLDGLQAALKDVIEPPADWLRRVRALDTLAESAALNAEWRRRRDRLVTAQVTPKLLEGFRSVYVKLWRNVRRLRVFLAALDDPKALPRDVPAAVAALPEGELRAAAVAACAARREEAVREAIQAITWGTDKAPVGDAAAYKAAKPWIDVRTQHADWRKSLFAALRDVAALQAGLDAARLLDDKAPGGADTLGALYAKWKDHRLVSDLGKPATSVMSRAASLETIADLNRGQLVARLRAIRADGSPEAALSLWLELGQQPDWPATLDELRLEAKARKALAEAAGRIKARDAERARWLDGQLEAEGPRRWERAFNAVARRVTEGLRDRDTAAVLLLRKPFGVDPKRLAPPARLRVALYELRDRAAGFDDKVPREQVDAAIDAFRKQAPAELAGQKPVAGLLAELGRIREQTQDDRPSAGLAKAGPAASPLASQWKAEVLDEGRAVRYTWAAKRHTLKFVRVEPSGDGRPAYLCTTEAPVGLFIDAMAAADRWVEANALLKPYDPDYEPPRGPRVWEWKRDRSGEIELPRNWLAREKRRGKHYPSGLRPGAPAAQHPMQYVSAIGAVYFARLLGCRLPSAAEWRAAHAAAGGSTKGNLRDPLWRRQQEHVRAKRAGGISAEWPDADGFVPDGVEAKAGEGAALTASADDGQLWFDTVGDPDGFHHLVGNVAELVFARPAVLDERLKGASALKASAVVAFLREQGAVVAVIGGSALSPPELWDGRDRPFDKPWPLPGPASREGYADVGFRLAFTAPRESAAARLQRLLRSAAYLPKLAAK